MFSVAFRCLPISTRKLFETGTKSDYPSIEELIEFLRQRVAVLEIVGESRKNTAPVTQVKSTLSHGQPRTGGERAWNYDKPHPISLVTATPDSSCPCCTGSHVLGSCGRFKAWPVNDRVRWVRDNRLCFNCLGADHWAPKCNSKARCRECSRKHHLLLHPPVGNIRSSDDTPNAEASLCASTLPPCARESTSIIFGYRLNTRARQVRFLAYRTRVN